MTDTPMMKQYKEIKAQHPDSVLFFRLGDFYEMFYEDAQLASKVLEITLTSRDSERKIPMCGVPHHAVDSYIAKMISQGYQVALCDQIGDPKTSKGIVKREVTRVITPGTLVEGQLLEDKTNNYIATILLKQGRAGLAYADISTGEFMVSDIEDTSFFNVLISELERLQVAELLLPDSFRAKQEVLEELKKRLTTTINYYRDDAFTEEQAIKYLQQQFNQSTLDKIRLADDSPALRAGGALVQFLLETQKRSLDHLSSLEHYHISQYMVLDYSARRNLELTKTMINGGKKGSLLWVLDYTATALGGRLLKKWIEQPLVDITKINARLDGVEELKDDIFLRADLHAQLKEVYDLERLTARVAYGSANARDLLALKNSLLNMPALKALLSNNKTLIMHELAAQIDPLTELVSLLTRGIADDPPVTLREGGLIKGQYNDEVDKLREASTSGRHWLAELEAKERDRTGIKSLKVRFNKVFGYFIEVTNSYLPLVPAEYQRKQTLTNAERFIIPELKHYEDMILGAQDKLIELEYQLFNDIRKQVALVIPPIQKNAQVVAESDVLLSLAEAAVKHSYIRPEINASGSLQIVEGRHPVVELMLNTNTFVPNDAILDTRNQFIALITGPNMGGKSTYQRQVGLITLMAQMGSFVPAQQAKIGIVDRIFARVGASDDLAAGHSTFMVEMQECNNALLLASKKSLVIIDELGRGTSNIEGMAIAQAVIEHIHNEIGCRTLFSTHYHELAELEGSLSGLKNYAAAVEEKGDNVIFLHRLVNGKASKSYGIHCARLAGLPATVIKRAHQLGNKHAKQVQAAKEVVGGNHQQHDNLKNNDYKQYCNPENAIIFNEISTKLLNIDLLNTTPIESLKVLFDLQKNIKSLTK